MKRPPSPEVLDDQRFGQYLARHGTARVLIHEIGSTPSDRKRIATWRNRYAEVPIEIAMRVDLQEH